jgi:hypothetical protein
LATSAVRFVRNSESEVWRDCRLKWYLSYFLGFLSDVANPNFWLGTFVHYCLSEWYLGNCSNPAHLFWMITEEWLRQNQSLRITIGEEDLDFNDLSEIEAYQKLGIEMLEGYVAWAAEHDDFDVIDSELAYYVPLEDHDGRPFTFVCRLDLLSENSEGIRIRDFKTAKDMRDSEIAHTYMQFRRYAWAVVEAHPDWAEEVAGSAWVGLRKMNPILNPTSKPPYYHTSLVDLTPAEVANTRRELVAEATEMLRVDEALRNGEEHRDLIYPSPRFDCSWKCQFFKNGLCQTWRAGLDVTEPGKLHGTWGNDPYEEYKTDDEASVLVIGRREGGDG